MVGMPRCVAKSPTIGMEPPERMKTVSLPKTSPKARAAVRIAGGAGLTRTPGGAGGDPDRGVVGIDDQAGSGAQHAHFGLNPLGGMLADPFAKRTDDLVGILARHNAEADFGDGFAGHPRLRTCRGKAAGDAVDFECGTRPDPLQHHAV